MFYNQQYGNTLLVKPPTTLRPVISSQQQHQQQKHQQQQQQPKNLADLDALQHIDLDAAGLSEYKHFVKNILPKYSHAIHQAKYYKKHTPVVSVMSGSVVSTDALTPKRASSSSQKTARTPQVATQQAYLNYYQNPQFLTAGQNYNYLMSTQPKASGNYAKYDNSNNNNNKQLFNSVYLSGY